MHVHVYIYIYIYSVCVCVCKDKVFPLQARCGPPHLIESSSGPSKKIDPYLAMFKMRILNIAK